VEYGVCVCVCVCVNVCVCVSTDVLHLAQVSFQKRILWTYHWTLRFYLRHELSWLDMWLSASQEENSFLELLNKNL